MKKDRFVIDIFGKVIYLRVWKIGAGMSLMVEKVDKGRLKLLVKVIWRAKGDLKKRGACSGGTFSLI